VARAVAARAGAVTARAAAATAKEAEAEEDSVRVVAARAKVEAGLEGGGACTQTTESVGVQLFGCERLRTRPSPRGGA
tara:strand:- start:416 stop:649 length:234 start_codon:yes stop_codon:yes gene_type:complete